MKVTFTPDFCSWKTECTCWQCQSKMEIVAGDLLYKLKKKWCSDSYGDGGSYDNCDHYYVNCPVCKAEIEINPIATKMHFLLQRKIKEKK